MRLSIKILLSLILALRIYNWSVSCQEDWNSSKISHKTFLRVELNVVKITRSAVWNSSKRSLKASFSEGDELIKVLTAYENTLGKKLKHSYIQCELITDALCLLCCFIK